MPLFPTEQWLEAYERSLAESSELDRVAATLGSDFETEIMLVITDLPLRETTVADLPEQMLGEVPPDIREESSDVTLAEMLEGVDSAVRSSLPVTLRARLEQFEETVFGGEAFVHIAIDEETVDISLMDEPGTYEVDSVFRGPCSTWQQFADGRPPLSLLLTGEMTMTTAGLAEFRHAPLFQILGDLATEVETEHIYREPDLSLTDAWIDETIRQSPQRFLHRQSALLLDAVTP